MAMASSVARQFWNEVLDLRTPVSVDRRERSASKASKRRRRPVLRKITQR